MKKWIVYIILISFLMPNSIALSAEHLNLPLPGAYVGLSSSIPRSEMKGLKINPDNPFNLDFIIDQGRDQLDKNALHQESEKMIKYFLAMLTIPQGDLWVNLSPYEKQRIISRDLEMTGLGSDMLAQDYLLKQLSASLTHPDKELGKKFWEEVYRKISAQYGNVKVPVNLITKVWIVPERASVYVKNNIVLITDRHLNVMMEEDYLAMSKNGPAVSSQTVTPNQEMLKKLILPVIINEVNEGSNFALMRQIYDAFILSVWYKNNLKASILNLTYSDQKKTAGIDSENKQSKESIYSQYLQAFKKGAYNLIKEDYDVNAQRLIPRKYFSGGVNLSEPMNIDRAQSVPSGLVKGPLSEISVHLDEISINRAMTASMPQLMKEMKRLLRMLSEEVENHDQEIEKDVNARDIFVQAIKTYRVKEGSDLMDLDLAFKRALDETIKGIEEGNVLYFNIQKPLQNLIEDFEEKIKALSGKKNISIADRNHMRYLSNFIVRIHVVLETIRLISAHRRLIRTLESRQYWELMIKEKEDVLVIAQQAREKRVGGLTAAIERDQKQIDAFQLERARRITDDPSLGKMRVFLSKIRGRITGQKVTGEDIEAQLANQDRRLNADLIPQIERLQGQIKDLQAQKLKLDSDVAEAERDLTETKRNISEKLSVVDRIKKARQMLRNENIAGLADGLSKLEKIEEQETYFISTSDVHQMADIGLKIKERRQYLGYKLKELSEFLGLGVSYQRLSQLEKGEGFLSGNERIAEDVLLILHYLAEALAIDFDSLHEAVLKFAYLEEIPDSVVDMQGLGHFFKQRREFLEISKEEMVSRGVSLSSINNYELGRALPNQGVGRGSRGVNYLRVMAEILRIDYDALRARVESIHDGFALQQRGALVESLITKQSVIGIIAEIDLEELNFEYLVSVLLERHALPESQRFHVIQRLRNLNLSNGEKIMRARYLEDQLDALVDILVDFLKEMSIAELNKPKATMLKKIEELMGDDIDMERIQEFLASLGYKDDKDFQKMRNFIDTFDRDKIRMLAAELSDDTGDLGNKVVEYIVNETGVEEVKVRDYLSDHLNLNDEQDFLDLLPKKDVSVDQDSSDNPTSTAVPKEYQGLSDQQRRSLLVEKLNQQMSILEPSFVRSVSGVAHLSTIVRSAAFTGALNDEVNVILLEARRAGADTGKGYQGQMHRDENDLNRRLAQYVLYLVKSDEGNQQIRTLFSLVYPDITLWRNNIERKNKEEVLITPEKMSYLEALYQILSKRDFLALRFPTVISADTIHMANEKLSVAARKANVTNFILLRDNAEFRLRGRSIAPEEFKAFKKMKGIDRAQTTGGIDLNERLLKLNGQDQVPGISFTKKGIQGIGFSGFKPVILKMTPITDLTAYLSRIPPQ